MRQHKCLPSTNFKGKEANFPSEDEIDPKKSDKDHGFTAFCRETTIHGIKYVGDVKLSKNRRIFWFLAVFFLLVACFWFTDWFIQNYSDNKVTTSIDTTTAPLSEVFFPSVTICNVNQVQQSFLDFLNMTQNQFLIFEKEFFVGRERETSEEEKAEINSILTSETIVSSFVTVFSAAFNLPPEVIKGALDSGFVTIELAISRMAMQIKPGDLIPYAKYKNMELFHQVTAYTGTDFGNCAEVIPYLFNHTANMFSQLPPALKDAKPGVTNGENNGMQMLLDAETYDYAFRSRSGEGFKVALHHHRDVAVMRQLGFNVAPGTVVNVAVNPVLSVTTESAQKRFHPTDRDCYFEEEIQLAHWPYNFTLTTEVSKRGQEGRYGMTNCMLEAALQTIEKECKCAPSFHPLGFDLEKHPSCQGYGITCVNKILDQLGEIDTIVDNGETKKCLAPCQDQTNNFQLSFLKFPNEFTFKLRKELCILAVNIRKRCLNPIKRRLLNRGYPEICDSLETLETQLGDTICDPVACTMRNMPDTINSTLVDFLQKTLYNYAKNNMAVVNIFIKDPYVTRLKRDEVFPVIVFVAGFGGLLGVFTGFSFVSAVEMVYFFFDWVILKLLNRKRY